MKNEESTGTATCTFRFRSRRRRSARCSARIHKQHSTCGSCGAFLCSCAARGLFTVGTLAKHMRELPQWVHYRHRGSLLCAPTLDASTATAAVQFEAVAVTFGAEGGVHLCAADKAKSYPSRSRRRWASWRFSVCICTQTTSISWNVD